MSTAATLPAHAPADPRGSGLARLALGALGIVYGDIGTSPLYAVKECFSGAHGVAPTPENVLGVLSLFFWALILVVVLKYLTFIMRADNHGEGGILALLALVMPQDKEQKRRRALLLLLGLFGAALLYGDGMITPAISVLGAIEGLQVATPIFAPVVVPITVAILIALFLIQPRGTGRLGAIFGPAMLVWFAAIAAAGLPWILRRPEILKAANPLYGAAFFVRHGWHGALVLGAVVLCITGGEALYADMGHFGRRSIRLAWYAVAFPALLINYFGQGALLLSRGVAAADNPFYNLVSGNWRYPMVLIATVAAVIASQALISGAFSLTRQAVQLGYWPRVAIVHTSSEAEGQIYVPEINWALMVACVALVVGFRESTNLAAAYGIAVTGTMGITSVLFYVVARDQWGWSRARAGGLVGLFLVIDLSFFGANAAKILHGGWFPLAVGAVVYTLMTTWKRGRSYLRRYLLQASMPIQAFIEEVGARPPHRVSGTAVFMTAAVGGTPGVLLHHFKHNKMLHEKVVLLSILGERVPEVPNADRVSVEELGEGFYQVVARYGFMQTPNVPELLRSCRIEGLKVVLAQVSYFLGRETLVTTGRSGMARWRKALFVFLSRNARSATAFFGIPPNRVVEMGAQIEI